MEGHAERHPRRNRDLLIVHDLRKEAVIAAAPVLGHITHSSDRIHGISRIENAPYHKGM